jgi:hypothetical protein
MNNTTISPNMGLIIPTVSVDPGPDWANNINASLSIVDQHNHSSGQGVQINPSGLNINSDLPFNNNNATLLRSVRFTSQSAALSGSTDLGCLYEAGVDLYYNDGNGNQIRITQSGNVAGASGTITGLPSGTASASFGSGTFVFQSATNTAANIDGGSYLLRNSSANSFALTLSPPNAMVANYNLFLPSIPSTQSFLTLDTSGNIAAYAPISAGLIGSNLANNTVTRTQLAAVGQQVSASCGTYTNSTTSYTQITNFSVTITTSGRPVVIEAIGDGTNGSSQSEISVYVTSSSLCYGFVQILRNGTVIYQTILGGTLGSSINQDFLYPPGEISFFDTPASGTYTYTVQTKVTSAGITFLVANCKLLAYEL